MIQGQIVILIKFRRIIFLLYRCVDKIS